MNPIITYYPNGNKKSEIYYNDLNEFHNELGPAVIYYYPNANKFYEIYYMYNKRHNIKGPSFIYYSENGKLKNKTYYLDNNIIHINKDEEFQKYIKRLNIS